MRNPMLASCWNDPWSRQALDDVTTVLSLARTSDLNTSAQGARFTIPSRGTLYACHCEKLER